MNAKCVTSGQNDSPSLDVVREVTHFCVNESIDSNLCFSVAVWLQFSDEGNLRDAISLVMPYFSCSLSDFGLQQLW